MNATTEILPDRSQSNSQLLHEAPLPQSDRLDRARLQIAARIATRFVETFTELPLQISDLLPRAESTLADLHEPGLTEPGALSKSLFASLCDGFEPANSSSTARPSPQRGLFVAMLKKHNLFESLERVMARDDTQSKHTPISAHESRALSLAKALVARGWVYRNITGDVVSAVKERTESTPRPAAHAEPVSDKMISVDLDTSGSRANRVDVTDGSRTVPQHADTSRERDSRNASERKKATLNATPPRSSFPATARRRALTQPDTDTRVPAQDDRWSERLGSEGDIVEGLLNARKADQCELKIHGATHAGSLVFNLATMTGRIIDLEAESSIDFRIEHVESVRWRGRNPFL